ncbi:hypothetical protein [Caudoviricetes sp.]|nr:hypothetical protein [Caudoviricetes sp.]
MILHYRQQVTPQFEGALSRIALQGFVNKLGLRTSSTH